MKQHLISFLKGVLYAGILIVLTQIVAKGTIFLNWREVGVAAAVGMAAFALSVLTAQGPPKYMALAPGMQRLRLGVTGTLMGMIPIRWTLIACNITGQEAAYAGWAQTKFNGMGFSAGIIKGTVFMEIADV